MENKCLSVDIGKITVSVKMDDEGVALDVIKKTNPIGFAPPEVYSQLGRPIVSLALKLNN